MKKKSLIMMVVTLALVAVVGVGSTLAYLTSTPEKLENTFTVGKVEITLHESNEATTDNEDDRTYSGNTYPNILPGDTLKKDPTVTIADDSAECYVYMQISGTKELGDLFTLNDFNEEWVKVKSVDGSEYDGIYRYDGEKTTGDLEALFETVTYSIEATETAEITDKSIVIKAFAIQKDNMVENGYDDAKILEIAENTMNGNDN